MGSKGDMLIGRRTGLMKEEKHLSELKAHIQNEVNRKKADGGLPIAQEHKLRDYHQWGTSAFYEHVLMPGESAQIEAELKNGAPKELSKSEQKSWATYRKNRYEMALRRERFFSISEDIISQTSREIENSKQMNQYTGYEILTRVEKTAPFNSKKLLKEERRGSVKDTNHEQVWETIAKLQKMIIDLQSFSPSDSSFQQLKDFMVDYCKIEEGISPVKMLRKERLKNMNICKDSHAGYIFLKHGILSLITYCSELLPVGFVQAEELAGLKGLSSAYGMMAAKIEMSSEFREKLQREIEIEEKIQVEEGQKEREAEEKTVIIMELLENLLSKQSYSQSNREAVGKAIKERYKITGADLDLPTELIIKEVEDQLGIFKKNRDILEEKVKTATIERLGFITPQLLEKILEDVVVLQTGDLLQDVTVEKIEVLSKRALEIKEAQFAMLSGRRDYIIKNKELCHLSRIPAEILLGMERIKEVILKESKQEDFEKEIKALDQQVDYNLTLIDDFLADKLSPLSHKLVFELILKHDSSEIVYGNFTKLWNMMEHYMEEVVPSECPRVMEIEKKLHEIMKQLEIGEEWKKYVFKNISKDDEITKIESKLKSLKDKLMSNQTLFDNKTAACEFPREKWAQVISWKEGALDKGLSEFKKEMEEELTREDFVRRSIISLKEYLEEEKEDAEEIDISSNYTNKNVLTYLICGWEGFEGALEGVEDEVMGALENLLKKGTLKATFPFLENIHNMDDLEALTFTEIQTLADVIHLNMSKAIRGWNLLIGAVENEVWQAMIPEMMLGTLQDNQVSKRADEIGKKQRENRRINQFRIRYAMRTSPVEGTGTLKYNHLDETDSKKLLSKSSRVKSRMERFRMADEVWSVLKENDMDQEVIKIIIEKGKSTGSGAAIHQEICNLMRKILFKKKLTRETGIMCEKFEEGKVKPEEYVNELRLCQLEGFLLDKKYDEDAYHTFTSAGLDEGYKELLRNKGDMVIRRIAQVHKVVNEVYGGRGFKPHLETVLLQLGPFISGLKEGHEAQNLKKFGIRSWQEALQVVKEEFLSRLGQNKGWEKVFELRHIEYEKHINERTKYLEQYQQGVLKPVMPFLMQDGEFWQSIAADIPSVFLEKVEAIYEKIKEPLTLLMGSFSYGEDFIRQVTEDLGNEIIYGKEKSREEWIDIFKKYFTDFCEHKVAGYSITTELRKLEEKNPKIAGYMTEMLLTHPDGLSLISTKEALKNTLEQCRKYVEPNIRALEGFLVNISHLLSDSTGSSDGNSPFVENLKQPITKGEETGFRLFVRKSILTVTPEKFPGELPGLWEEFQKLQEKTRQKAIESAKAMEEKRNIFFELEERRKMASEADSREQEKIIQLQNIIKIPGSPLLAALGVKRIPRPIEVEKVNKRLESYGGLSKAVRNCYLEITLSGLQEDKLERQLQWLISTEEQISKIKFVGGERLKEGSIGSFLTFLYIRHQAGIFTGELLTEDRIREEFHVMGQRLLKMKELQNKSMNRESPGRKDVEAESFEESAPFMAKRRMITEAMSVGLFMLEEKEFDSLITGQSQYLENAVAADKVFKEVITSHVKEKEDMMLLRLGLLEYFHKEFLQEMSLQEIRLQAEKLLADKTSYNALIATVRMNGGYVEGKAIMEGISSTGLKAGEKKLSLTATRETLERFLADKKNDKFRQSYNRLDREQRQVFALAVLQAEKKEELPSRSFIRSDELEEARQLYVKSCLERYVEGRDFHPEIYYDRVMEILVRHDGRMNGEVFTYAMDTTIELIRKRRSKLPKDLIRLSDAQSSIQAAAVFVKEAGRKVEHVSNLTEWKNTILDYDDKVKGKTQEIRERFRGMDKYQLPILVAILQDRTILDQSTLTVKKEEKVYANQEECDKMKQLLHQGRGPRIVSGTINQALLTLRSYQLRDDVELINKKLSKNDFAPKALERGTVIDWELLNRAMDFMKGENF